MNQDHTFRVSLIIAFLIILPVMVYYRLKSQTTGESLDRRQEGVFMLATLRPVGLLIWAGIIAYLIDPSWMVWSSMPLPNWMRWAGVGVSAVAAGLLFWTLGNLGPNLTDTVVTRKVHTMVSGGPYRWVRHPFYDSVLLLVLATSLAAANWFLLAAGALFFLLCIVRTRTEEEKLVARFGDAYRVYMDRTGRFVPRMGRTLRQPTT